MFLNLHNAIATVLQQILTQPAGCYLPRTMDNVIPDAKVEFVRRLKIRVARELHYVVLAHTLFEPVADGGPSEVVEFTFFNARSLQDFCEVPATIAIRLTLLFHQVSSYPGTYCNLANRSADIFQGKKHVKSSGTWPRLSAQACKYRVNHLRGLTFQSLSV